MTRTILLVGALVVALTATFLLTAVKRVPEGSQGLVIHADGTTSPFDAGMHLVRPFSGRLVLLPFGAVEYRFPLEGTYEVLMADGSPARVALSVRTDFVEGSGPFILSTLGEDVYLGLEPRIKEAIELHAAQFPSSGDMPAGYRDAVIADATATLNDSRALLTQYRFEEWQTQAAPAVTVSADPIRKVVFLGVDGADWIVIRQLIAQGRLPNFAKLVREGATGELRSIEPMLSPLIWTTMATGKLPEDHGILNFTVVDPETGLKVPISRLYRKVDAFWNMLSDHGRSVHIVGWLATFPAEPINGVMVTDRLGYLAYADAEQSEGAIRGSVSPESKQAGITDLVVESGEVSWEEFRRFIGVDRQSFLENRALAFDPKNPINNMIMLYASTRTYEGIARALVGEDPDFVGVYFELVDATKHLFMQYAPPKQPDIEPAAFELFGNAVTEAYVVQDSIIGEFMERLDDRTVLMVASDHGFKSGASRPKLSPEIWAGKAAFWHRINGIICLYGAGVRQGVTFDGASILDITPTILGLQGLPKPSDMPGRILEEAFESGVVSQLNRDKVATLQRKRELDELATNTGDAATDEALKKLEALGYITPENPDAHNNLGQRYQEQGKYLEAIEEFKKALAINPDFPGAWNNLGVCYGRLQRYEEAEQALRRSIQLNPEGVHAMNNLAVMFMSISRLDDAREYAERMVSIEPQYANGLLTLGAIYATMGELDLAEQQFVKALEIDPGNRGATANLEKIRRQRDAN